ncbi:Os03g0215600, partial [Oryza sativa Japonica Group]
MKASDEAGTSKRKKCTECNELGHTAKTCQGGPTASQKRIHSSSEIGTGDGNNDTSAAATSNASASARGRGRGRGRGGGG